MDQIVKEPERLLFSRGAINKISFNSEGKFRNLQLACLFIIPSEDCLRNFNIIKVLKFPLVLKDIVFEISSSKKVYIYQGFLRS